MRESPEEIENKLKGVFKFFESITPTEAEKIKVGIKKNHAQETEYKENAIKTLNTRYEVLQSRLDTLYNDRLDGKITTEFWEHKREETTTEQTNIQEQIKKLKGEEAKYFEVWLNIIDLAGRAREIYDKRSPEEKRLLLSHIFTTLTLKDNEISYVLKPAMEKISKRIQQKLDEEKTFEPHKNGSTKTQKDSFESLCPALLRRQGSNL